MLVEATQLTGHPGEHVCLLYEHDGQLVDEVGAFLVDGLRTGGAAIVVATSDHRRLLGAYLAERGVDPTEAEADGRLHLLDAEGTLARFLVNGRPDAGRFASVMGGLVRQVVAAGRPVRAFGEMVALLWDDGLVNEAVELEQLWNDLGQEAPFSLFCAYPMQSMRDGGHAAVDDVCRLHTAMFPERREATRTFEATLDAPLESRRFVTAFLRGRDHRALVEDAAMVVTELATNAVLHACGRFSVTVIALGNSVRIAVQDDSPRPPLQKSRSLTSQTGRGLAMVAAVAAGWGSELRPDGKVTWAELHPSVNAV